MPLPLKVRYPQALPWSMFCKGSERRSARGRPRGPPPGAPPRPRAARRRYLGRVVRPDLGDHPVAGLVVRPEPGLAGDRAAHAEARQAAEQRQQPALAARVPPGQRRQPLLRQRPPHALVVQGEALRVPRPLLQRPVLPDLLGHGGDGPLQLLARHGAARPGPGRFLPARKAPRSARRAGLWRRPPGPRCRRSAR